MQQRGLGCLAGPADQPGVASAACSSRSSASLYASNANRVVPSARGHPPVIGIPYRSALTSRLGVSSHGCVHQRAPRRRTPNQLQSHRGSKRAGTSGPREIDDTVVRPSGGGGSDVGRRLRDQRLIRCRTAGVPTTTTPLGLSPLLTYSGANTRAQPRLRDQAQPCRRRKRGVRLSWLRSTIAHTTLGPTRTTCATPRRRSQGRRPLATARGGVPLLR